MNQMTPSRNSYLAHYGVKGMKWGVRKDRGSARVYRKAEKYEKKWHTNDDFYSSPARTRASHKRHQKNYVKIYNNAVNKEAREVGASKASKHLADSLAKNQRNTDAYDNAIRTIASKETRTIAEQRRKLTDLAAPMREAAALSSKDTDRYAREELGRRYDNKSEAYKKSHTKEQYIKGYDEWRSHEWYEAAQDAYIRKRIGAKNSDDLSDYYHRVNEADSAYQKSCKKLVSKVLGVYGKRKLNSYGNNTITNVTAAGMSTEAYWYPERTKYNPKKN